MAPSPIVWLVIRTTLPLVIRLLEALLDQMRSAERDEADGKPHAAPVPPHPPQ